MADDKDDVADQWGAQFDGREDAPSVGVNKEMLRKALKLNPNLRAQTSTTDVMKQLEKASSQRTVAAQEEPKKRAPTDVVTGLTQYRERYQEEKKRLQTEIATLQKQMQALAPAALEKVLDLIVQLDPNMTAMPTQEIIKVEGQFLNEIQFSAKKIVERKLRKR